MSGTSARLEGAITIRNTNLSFNDPIPGRGGNRATALLDGSVAIRDNSSVFVDSSPIIFGNGVDRVQCFLNGVTDSSFTEFNSSNTQFGIIYVAGEIRNSTFTGIKLVELLNTNGVPPVRAGVKFINKAAALLNWESGVVDLPAINIPSTTTGWQTVIGNGRTDNEFRFWNPVAFSLPNLLIGNPNGRASLGYTITLKIVNSTLQPVSGVTARYRDDRTAIGGVKADRGVYTTNAQGTLAGTYDSKTASTGANINRPTLWVRASQTVLTGVTRFQNPLITGGSPPTSLEHDFIIQNISSEIEIKSYLHLENGLITTPSAEIGKIATNESVVFFSEFLVIEDPGVTQINPVTVGAYAGIAHTPTTITISAAHTLSEIWDSRKLYWRDNAVSVPTKEGTTADFGSANIAINAAVTADAKYSKLRTTGTITFGASGTVDFPTQDVTGLRLRIYGLPANNYSPIVRVEDALGNLISAPVNNGEASISVLPGAIYKLRAAAKNFKTSDPVTVNSDLASSVEFSLIEYLDEDGVGIYSKGNAAVSSLITFVPQSMQLRLFGDGTTPTYTINDAVRALGDLLTNVEALAMTALPYYSNGEIIFPLNSGDNLPNPARIIPSPDSVADPAIDFKVVDGVALRPDRLFPVSPTGFIVRYPTSVSASPTLNVFDSGGFLTPTQPRNTAPGQA